MKIIYYGKNDARLNILRNTKSSFLAIGWDKWDDYSYKTYLPCRLIVDGNNIEISAIRILIEGSSFTAETLEQLLLNGWDGSFPIPNLTYTSVPSDINFYQIIHGKLGEDAANSAVIQLKDASYHMFLHKDQGVEALTNSEGFVSSLMREGGARKAYQDGWRQFAGNGPSSIHDFQLRIPSRFTECLEYKFHFNSELLPYDINVLIGPNGVGKSHCLQSLVEYWLKIGRGDQNELVKTEHQPFDKYPNISKLILVSYSPFEEFTLDLLDTNLSSKDAYQYFGFRRRVTDDEGEHVGISRNLPAHDSVISILRCINEDNTLGYINGWVGKFNSAIEVLGKAINFSGLALALNSNVDVTDPVSIAHNIAPHIKEGGDGQRFVIIHENTLGFLCTDSAIEYIDATKGILFLDESGEVVNLSSGQRLFSYIVVNVLGALKFNSLVVVDEPELFLHPNLEITFISLLKLVLVKFKSKAILATHSLVSVREIPAKCVHVIRKIDSRFEIVRPPFETFGGDIQRISSYVFGDRSVTKPYEEWIRVKSAQYQTSSDFVDALGSEVNEELIMRILSLEKI